MAIIKSNFQKIFDKNQMYLQDMQNKSLSWYWKQVDELKKQRITPTKLINDNANKSVAAIIPGNLYFWSYDPKTKDTLPYYDTAPMVFPFTPAKGGFIGINLHYLPYKMRIILLDELLEYKNNKFMDEKTKIKMSWSMLKSLSNNKLVEPCVKRYLYSHVRSNIIKIDSYHYATALMLPVARFKKASEIAVWMESVRGKK